jgi:ATP-dependent protease ClpP protease subunit
MEYATIYITGQIGTYEEVKGIELLDVIKQVQSQPNALVYNVYINSEGGVVDVGMDIYNYLMSIRNSQKKIVNTIGSGIVASAATLPFMAGETRSLRPNTEFMIHMPAGSVKGTSEQIDQYNEMLKTYDKKILDFYTKVTGLTPEAILPLLKNETWLSIDDAFDMNFVTEMEIDFPAVAKAKYNFKLDTKMTKEDKDWIENLFSPFAKFLKGKKIVNKTVTDANGAILDFADLADDTMPQVGDMATVNSEPANGEYLLPSGEMYVFDNGTLTEIVPVEEDETAALKEENDSLKQQIADLTAEKNTMSENFEALKSEVVNLKKSITSKLDFDSKSAAKKEEKTETKRKLLKD